MDYKLIHICNDPLKYSKGGYEYMSCMHLTAMWEYCKMRGKANGPLFMFQDNTPISRHMFSNQLQISLTFLGYDNKFYKSHLFRIGAAETGVLS
jgi:hypothetical protein